MNEVMNVPFHERRGKTLNWLLDSQALNVGVRCSSKLLETTKYEQKQVLLSCLHSPTVELTRITRHILNLISSRAHLYVQAMREVCSINFLMQSRSSCPCFFYIYKRKLPFASFNVIRSLNF